MNKNMVISGASSGLGKALALTYADKGVILGLIGKDLIKLNSIARCCREKGAHVEILSCDLSHEFKILQRWIIQFEKKYGVDLIIANAGITASSSSTRQLEDWHKTKVLIETNVLGVMGLLHPLVKLMQQRKKGHIVIISSIAAHYGMPITPSYCASKAALKNYGEALRGLLYQDNIKISIVYPGFIKTAMSDQFPGPKPFMIPAEKAASIIKKGIQKQKKTIAFPKLLNFGMVLLSILPTVFADFILRNYRNK